MSYVFRMFAMSYLTCSHMCHMFYYMFAFMCYMFFICLQSYFRLVSYASYVLTYVLPQGSHVSYVLSYVSYVYHMFDRKMTIFIKILNFQSVHNSYVSVICHMFFICFSYVSHMFVICHAPSSEYI